MLAKSSQDGRSIKSVQTMIMDRTFTYLWQGPNCFPLLLYRDNADFYGDNADFYGDNADFYGDNADFYGDHAEKSFPHSN